MQTSSSSTGRARRAQTTCTHAARGLLARRQSCLVSCRSQKICGALHIRLPRDIARGRPYCNADSEKSSIRQFGSLSSSCWRPPQCAAATPVLRRDCSTCSKFDFLRRSIRRIPYTIFVDEEDEDEEDKAEIGCTISSRPVGSCAI